MLIYDFFGMSIGALVIWGFLMASLLHLFFYILKVQKNLQLLVASILLFTSYFVSDFIIVSDSYNTAIHGIFALFDLFTLLALFLVTYTFFKDEKLEVGVLYTMIGLTVNTVMFFFMYIDTYVYENVTRWLLWYLYSYIVISVDFIMVTSLLVNKDWLGIKWAISKVRARVA
ncbi:hypothetical protein B1L02_16405 [Pseudoalteromonas piscicida]|uniref:Uncharacterized protein n=2 Tax=Pseudoalteromonas piscicida TaxID=43662 RepID=A0AAD0W5D8_PSEO7|nr:hypothetical protein B1L02_16405 [Pseudoalteromonas piscicida]AXR03487.1 hypothetical protein D0511_16460 [Pseudoalteromonas piscicida]